MHSKFWLSALHWIDMMVMVADYFIWASYYQQISQKHTCRICFACCYIVGKSLLLHCLKKKKSCMLMLAWNGCEIFQNQSYCSPYEDILTRMSKNLGQLQFCCRVAGLICFYIWLYLHELCVLDLLQNNIY